MKWIKNTCVSYALVSGLFFSTSLSYAQDMNINPYPDNSVQQFQAEENDEAFQPDQAVILELLARQRERKKAAASKPISLSHSASVTKNAGTVQEKQHRQEMVKAAPRMKDKTKYRKDVRLLPAPQKNTDIMPSSQSVLGEISAEKSTAKSSSHRKGYFRSTKKVIPITEWANHKRKARKQEETDFEEVNPRAFKQPDWDSQKDSSKKHAVVKSAPVKASVSIPPKPIAKQQAHVVAKIEKVIADKKLHKNLDVKPSDVAGGEVALDRSEIKKIAMEIAREIMKESAVEGKSNNVAATVEAPQKTAPKRASEQTLLKQSLKEADNAKVPSQNTLAAPVKRQKIVPTQTPSAQPSMADVKSLRAAEKKYKEILSVPKKRALDLLDAEKASVVAQLDNEAKETPAYVHEQAVKRGLQSMAGQLVPSLAGEKSEKKAVQEAEQQSLAQQIASEDKMIQQQKAIELSAFAKQEELRLKEVQEQAKHPLNAGAQGQSRAVTITNPQNAVAIPDQYIIGNQTVYNKAIIAAKPMIPRWEAKQGASAYKTLSYWSRNAGVDLIWNSQFLVDIYDDINVSGSYEQAVQALLMQYQGLSAGVQGALYVDDVSGKRTLVIETNPS